MDFNVKNHWIINLGGFEIWVTESIVSSWIIMAVLIVFALIVRIKLRKFDDGKPSGFQNVIELLVEMFDRFMMSITGEKLASLGSWFFAVFAFVLVSNISGLVGMRPPTADWAVTFACAFWTFLMIQYYALKHRGGKYLKSFFEPLPFLFPLNIIGELARPISLSFRLFGNLLGGMIILSLVYTIAPIFVRFGFPAALNVYFDLFAGAIQAYIFCTLSLSFITAAAED